MSRRTRTPDLFTTLQNSFVKDTSDASWLSSLPRIASPPPPPPQAVHPVTASSPPAASVSSEHSHNPSYPLPASTALQAKLESFSKENERLMSALRRLEGFEAGMSFTQQDYSYFLKQFVKAAQQAEASFAAERKRVENLTKSLQKLQDDTEITLQNERQTVALLVTEKAHLTSELQKRANFESSRYSDFLYHIGFLM